MLLFTPQERRAIIFLGAAFFCGVCLDIAFKFSPPSLRALNALDQPLDRTRLDINQATYDELVKIPGVGPSTAARILYARERQGRFASVNELRRIKGFSRRMFARAAGHMIAGPP